MNFYYLSNYKIGDDLWKKNNHKFQEKCLTFPRISAIITPLKGEEDNDHTKG